MVEELVDSAESFLQEGKDGLEKGIEGAKSEDEVKAEMKSSIEGDMREKKSELVRKASKAADKVTEDAARARAKRSEDAKDEKQNDKISMAKDERESAKRELVSTDTNKKMVIDTALAEEKAKIATANRIAAEEIAKTSAAQRIAAEEDAKKAAATKVTANEQAESAEKSPQELHALEAKAFGEAAELKIKEGQALAKVAAIKSGTDLKKRTNGAMAKKGVEAQDLAEAKRRLTKLVKKATAALDTAKAKPFDKAALKAVIDIKKLVKEAKEDVMRMSADVKQESATVAGLQAKEAARDGTDMPSAKSSDDDKIRSKYDVDNKMESKNLENHAESRKWSNKEVKYWANKKMDWKYDDPMNKNKVMGKIFALKNMEAQTLTKMNEMNTQVGMNSTGVRAGMMAKGETVVVGGELVKAKPSFHISQTFQGQKGRDPMTENDGRDPDRDGEKTESMDQTIDHIHSEKSNMNDQIANARHARRPVRSYKDVTNGVPRPQRPTAASIKSLKKTLPPKEESLGESDDDEEQQDEDSVERMSQEEDDEEMQDDNDVDIAEDEASLDGDDEE